MKLTDFPCEMIDWASEPPSVMAGAIGTATAWARNFGDLELRLVEYSAGYLADHRGDKGHILFVTERAVTIEHRDGRHYELTPGASWRVADNGAPAHRVICEHGVIVFIVD